MECSVLKLSNVFKQTPRFPPSPPARWKMRSPILKWFATVNKTLRTPHSALRTPRSALRVFHQAQKLCKIVVNNSTALQREMRRIKGEGARGGKSPGLVCV